MSFGRIKTHAQRIDGPHADAGRSLPLRPPISIALVTAGNWPRRDTVRVPQISWTPGCSPVYGSAEGGMASCPLGEDAHRTLSSATALRKSASAIVFDSCRAIHLLNTAARPSLAALVALARSGVARACPVVGQYCAEMVQHKILGFGLPIARGTD